jgi:hypothetical protein
LSVNRYLNTTLSVYPNPAKERMQVNYGRIINNGKLELYNNFGQLVFTQVIIGQSSSRVELKHFSAGMYTLYLTVGEDRIACKIMIE